MKNILFLQMCLLYLSAFSGVMRDLSDLGLKSSPVSGSIVSEYSVIRMKTTRIVPYDAEIEYLESVDVQYIDTGVPLSKDIGYEIDFDYMRFCEDYPTGTRYMCNWSARTNFWSVGTIFRGYRLSAIWGSTDQFYFISPVPSSSHSTLSFNFKNSGRIDFDNMTCTLPSRVGVVPTGEKSLLIFCWRNGNNDPAMWDQFTHASSRVYEVKVSVGNRIVRDLIPVRIGQIGYMYDQLNPSGGPLCNGLYPNVGNGAFVVGPDKE